MGVHIPPLSIGCRISGICDSPQSPSGGNFDIHPQWPPRCGLTANLATTHTGWNWKINTALLGAPQSRERKLHLYAPGTIPPSEQLAPLFVLDIFLPQNIQDCTSNEDHTHLLLHGDFRVNYLTPNDLLTPSSLVYIKLYKDQYVRGNKVQISKGKTGTLVCPLGPVG